MAAPVLCRSLAFASFCALAAAGLVACEQDYVFKSVEPKAVCGNGIVEQGEQCDAITPSGGAPSEGCTNCQIAPEWQCPNNVCAPDCNDPGVMPNGLYCSRMATCNMQGWWAVRETDTTIASGAPTTSTQWYLYHVSQPAGEDTYKIDVALDCGISVSGSAAYVEYTPGTQYDLIYKSGIDVPPHGPRKGLARELPGGGQCDVSLNRFFFIRGATNAFLPLNFDSDASLPSSATEPWLGAPPIPAQACAPTCGNELVNDTTFPQGAIDQDRLPDAGADAGPSYPGGGFAISGSVFGIRHSAQRDYKGYASVSPVPAFSLSFTFPGNYGLQESVLSVTNCHPDVICGLIAMIAAPTNNPAPYVTFSYIGLDPTSTRAKSVIVGTPKQNYTSDLATCANLRLILPHDETIHDGSTPPDASTR